jgi:hypothetical protein
MAWRLVRCGSSVYVQKKRSWSSSWTVAETVFAGFRDTTVAVETEDCIVGMHTQTGKTRENECIAERRVVVYEQAKPAK